MTIEELLTGIQLKGIIDYYTSVVADLADDTKKERTLYALLSSGNGEAAAGGETSFISDLRNGIITSVINTINTRKASKQSDFDALGSGGSGGELSAGSPVTTDQGNPVTNENDQQIIV